jgi:hypothetical protein
VVYFPAPATIGWTRPTPLFRTEQAFCGALTNTAAVSSGG